MFLPITQQDCDIFVTLLNSHRIRSQNDCEVQNGIRNQMFSFTKQHGGTQKGIKITSELLQEESGLNIENGNTTCDFMDK